MSKRITDKIKELGVQRFYDERFTVRNQAIEHTPKKNTTLELYAGNEGMTFFYKRDFKKCITVDVDESSTSLYKMTAMKYLEAGLLKDKIDLVDFDAYGGPHFEIQRFFDMYGKQSAPFTIAITDGLGLGMKRSRSLMKIDKRFLVNNKDGLDLRHAWKIHPLLTKLFIERLAERNELQAKLLSLIQAKTKNFVFSSWLITKK